MMTIGNASNDESLDRALVKCLRLFAKHGRKIRHEKTSQAEDRFDSYDAEKEIKDSSNHELVQVHCATDVNIYGKV